LPTCPLGHPRRATHRRPHRRPAPSRPAGRQRSRAAQGWRQVPQRGGFQRVSAAADGVSGRHADLW